MRAVVLLLMAAASAHAYTADQIDRAARKGNNGLRTVVRKLASDKLLGRDNATPSSLDAQTWLIRKLRRLGPGLDGSQTGDAAYQQPFVLGGQTGTNLLAVIPGSEVPDEYVVVGAHYDHLDTRSPAGSGDDGHCSSSGLPGGEVCNGATDNATGVAAVLAIGKAIRNLPVPPRRSIILALWDAEEDGLVGSLYYVTHPLVPLAQTVAYVNFDIAGAVLLPSLRAKSFAVGAETGGSALAAFVDAAVATEALDTRRLSYIFGQFRSDYVSFGGNGVPTVFFSDSTGSCYHKTGDDVRIVDWSKLKAQSRIGLRVTADTAEALVPPPFRAPNPALATYPDAVVVSAALTAGLADLAFFSAPQQALLQQRQADVAAIVAAGPAAFDSAAVSTLLASVVDTINLLTQIPCQKMF